MNRPLFSIITCTFNAELTLARTLGSVASQSFTDYEHVIIDGASKDGTLALLSHPADGYQQCGDAASHTRVFSEPDKGLYDAMNKGIARARGRYLIFLNAGDKFHSADTLSEVATHIYNNTCANDGRTDGMPDDRFPAVVYGETDLVDDEGRFIRHRRLQTPESLTWRSFLNGMVVCHQSFYVRRDIALLESYNLQYRFSADFDWCIRCMRRAQKMGAALSNTHLILTDYLSEGITTANRRKSLFERLRIMAGHYGWLRTVIQHCWFVLRLAKA
ncbi:MAG: glycosyltransferase [Bacteroidales bacterium]|nr:glycosyltransferase [Candidatus Liminaster caballi]